MTGNNDSQFAEFGDAELVSMTKIQRLVAKNLTDNWRRIPHVFHQDEADVTQLEAARKTIIADRGKRITALSFYVKALQKALKRFPVFNASLDDDGKTVVLKRYCNIGIATSTPSGLVVPVIRQVDQKTIFTIAEEIETLSAKAQAGKVSFQEMSGGSMTISSLGPNGGTGFTPIINAPEVAILGLSRLLEKPVRRKDDGIDWRRYLPLSLSYDHRVINGADAAQFMRFLVNTIETPSELVDDGLSDAGVGRN